MKKLLTVFFILLTMIFVSPGFAADPPSDPTKLENVGEVLFVFLVLALVFETALTPLFNWRVFLARFDEQGYKIPITVVLAFLFFKSYDLDIVADLLNALNGNTDQATSTGGQILTSLLIAGGSDGVFRIFAKLNIRDLEGRKLKADDAKKALELDKKAKEAKKEEKRAAELLRNAEKERKAAEKTAESLKAANEKKIKAQQMTEGTAKIVDANKAAGQG